MSSAPVLQGVKNYRWELCLQSDNFDQVEIKIKDQNYVLLEYYVNCQKIVDNYKIFIPHNLQNINRFSIIFKSGIINRTSKLIDDYILIDNFDLNDDDVPIFLKYENILYPIEIGLTEGDICHLNIGNRLKTIDDGLLRITRLISSDDKLESKLEYNYHNDFTRCVTHRFTSDKINKNKKLFKESTLELAHKTIKNIINKIETDISSQIIGFIETLFN